MNDEPLVSELPDLTNVSLAELLTSTDPALDAAVARVLASLLDDDDGPDRPCTAGGCGY